MRTLLSVLILFVLTLGAAHEGGTQNGNPFTANAIPEPITKRGLMVEIRDVVRLPQTRGLRPADQDVTSTGWARVSYVRDLPDGRRFANDSRGMLYLLDRNNQPSLYANVAATFPFLSTTDWRAGSSDSSFTPSLPGTGCSTPCMASALPATRRRRTSSHQGSRKPM